MSYYVYRYIDKSTNIIKYVGISNSKQSLDNRIRAHKRDDWYKKCQWRIEYIEVDNQSVAESLESHLISLWNTDRWYNVAKAGWGINPYLPTEHYNWILYRHDQKDNSVEGDIEINDHHRQGSFKHGFTSKDATESEHKIYNWWNRMCGDRCADFEDPYKFYQWVINHTDYSPEKFPKKIDESLAWSPSNIMFTDSRKETDVNKKMITYNGETHSMTEWAKIIGITLSGLSRRLSRCKTLEQALAIRT